MIINSMSITRPAMTPPTNPNTIVIQKLRNTMSPNAKPVTGPPNLAQK